MDTPMLSIIRFGLDATLKATLLLALVLCLVVALRRASAAVRHMAAVLGLAGALALPFVGLFVPRVSIPLVPSILPNSVDPASAPPLSRVGSDTAPDLPIRTGVSRAAVPVRQTAVTRTFSSPADGAATGASLAVTISTARTAPARAPAAPFPWAAWTIGIWAAGALIASSRLLLGSLRVRTIAREGEPMRDREWLAAADDIGRRLSLKSRVRIVTSPEVPVAMTAGARSPVLMLSAAARKWPADRRRVVLLHELAHVRRGDWITLLVSELALAVYWFHPLAWIARREIRLNGERACDDLVIGDGTKPSVYAAHLLGIVRSFTPGSRTALPVMAMARPSQFEGRMRAILDPGLHRRGPSSGQIRAAALGLFTSVLALSALQPWAPRTAEGAAMPGFEMSASMSPTSGASTRTKAQCRQNAAHAADTTDTANTTNVRCVKKPAPAPSPSVSIAFAPPLLDASGFVKAVARIAAVSPAPSPADARPAVEVVPAPQRAPVSAPMPAGIVLASNRHEHSGEEWYDRAMTLHHSGRYDAAIAAFARAIEGGYREDAATYNTACAYALKGDKDHAFEWLRKAMDAGFSVSSYLSDDDDLDSLRSDPRYATLKVEVRSHRGNKEIEDARGARTRYARLVERAKAPKDAYFSSARDLLNAHEYALAAKAYRRSAEIGYRAGTSYYNEACALALGGDKTGALDSLQRALENGFDDPSLFKSDDDLESLHGDARFRQLASLARDLEMPSTSIGSKIFRSSERQQWREAAQDARVIAAKYPNLGRTWFNLGLAELKGERPEAAAEAFEKALALSYRKPTTLYNLACSLAKAGQKDKAFERLFQALDAGFDESSTLRDDEDLDSLHSDPRFRKAERIVEQRSDED